MAGSKDSVQQPSQRSHPWVTALGLNIQNKCCMSDYMAIHVWKREESTHALKESLHCGEGKHGGEPERNWDLFLSSFLIKFLRPSFRQSHLTRSGSKSNCFGNKLGRDIYLTLDEPMTAQRNTNLLLPQARAPTSPLWAPGNDPSVFHIFGPRNCQNVFQDPADTDLLV